MILLDSITREAINPALALLPPQMDSSRARVMLLAIGLQESRFMHRYQIVQGKPGAKGPAKSFWQMEEGGGVRGVMTHHATKALADHLCERRHIPFTTKAVHNAIETDDVLAAGFARLLLWSDSKPLPDVDDVEGAWELYAKRTWRPGKPHRATWDEFHAQAVAQVMDARA